MHGTVCVCARARATVYDHSCVKENSKSSPYKYVGRFVGATIVCCVRVWSCVVQQSFRFVFLCISSYLVRIWFVSLRLSLWKRCRNIHTNDLSLGVSSIGGGATKASLRSVSVLCNLTDFTDFQRAHTHIQNTHKNKFCPLYETLWPGRFLNISENLGIAESSATETLFVGLHRFHSIAFGCNWSKWFQRMRPQKTMQTR